MRDYWSWLRDAVAAAGDEDAGALAERLVTLGGVHLGALGRLAHTPSATS